MMSQLALILNYKKLQLAIWTNLNNDDGTVGQSLSTTVFALIVESMH